MKTIFCLNIGYETFAVPRENVAAVLQAVSCLVPVKLKNQYGGFGGDNCIVGPKDEFVSVATGFVPVSVDAVEPEKIVAGLRVVAGDEEIPF